MLGKLEQKMKTWPSHMVRELRGGLGWFVGEQRGQKRRKLALLGVCGIQQTWSAGMSQPHLLQTLSAALQLPIPTFWFVLSEELGSGGEKHGPGSLAWMKVGNRGQQH